MKKLILCGLVLCSIQAMAAESPGTPNTGVASSSTSDFFNPGWSGKYRHGIGYSTSLLNTNTFIYDHYLNSDYSVSVYVAYNNAQDNAGTTVTDSGTTTTESNSGARSMGIITLAAGYNMKIFRNEWSNIRIGMLAGLNYFNKTDYQVGVKTITNATGAVAYSAYGTTYISRSPQFIIGPILSTAFNIRWFPMISAGMDGGILFYTDSKTKTKSVTQTGAVIGTSESESSPGLSATTTGNGLFGFSTSFSVRYVW